MAKLGGLCTILTKDIILWRSAKTKEPLFFLGAENCGEVSLWGELVVDKGYLGRFFCADSLQYTVLISGDKCWPSMGEAWETPWQGGVYALF